MKRTSAIILLTYVSMIFSQQLDTRPPITLLSNDSWRDGPRTTITIADARAAGVGATVTTAGIITTPNFGSTYSEFGLQDSTAGIVIYMPGNVLNVAVGDSVEITGTISEYNGKLEIVPATDADVTVLNSGNPLPDFQVITVATFVGNGEDYESELIRINGASIVSGTWPTGGGSVNLTISDDGGTSTVTMRIDSDTDIIGNPEPSDPFDVQGIAGQYNDYQILPRYYSDFNPDSYVSAPDISNITLNPSAPADGEAVTVSATITDDGTIASATLTYDAGAGNVDSTMVNTSGDVYEAVIPGQSTGTQVSFYITAVDNDGNSTTSDTMTYTVLPAGGTVTAIYDIQYTTDPSGDSPLDGQTVTISGVVTAEFWGSSGNKYMFVQDSAGPWSGILIYESGGWDNFNFQSSSGVVHSVAEGDSITLTGTVSEYYGVTEITNVTDAIIHGPAVNMIPPSTVTPGEIMTGGTDAEAYEGCLVRVVNVTVDNPDLGFGEWSVTDGTNSVRVDDRWDYYYFPVQGQSLSEVVGCLDYSYSNTKIQPRLARDVAEDGNVRLQRIQQVLYSDLLKAGTDYVSDKSYMLGDTVTVEGIVTMPTGLSYAGAGVKFIFQDENGGPWSSILSYDPDSSAFPVLYEGDRIRVTGFVSEYTTSNSNMTELFITQPIDLLAVGEPEPTVPDVLTGDLRWPTTAEQWGTVMVRANNAIVIENDLPYGEWSIDDGSGKVNVDDDSDSISTWQEANGRPPVGTYIESIEGWIYHHYGSYMDSTTYKLEPLYPSDIVFGAGPPNIQNVTRDPCVPGPNDDVTIFADILDNSTVVSAEIVYTVDGGTPQTVSMTTTNDTTWSGVIPATGTDGAVVYYYVSATDDGVDQSEPKTSTYPFDTALDQLGYLAKSGNLTIYDVQYTPWASGNSLYDGCEVTVTGIITGDTAQYTSGYGAYALQSESAQWSGILFDGWDDSQLTRGDEVTVTGTVEEFDPTWHFKYDNNTKLINISNVTVVSTGNTIAPLSVTTADLAQDAEEVESYEGCLVTLSNVTVTALNQYDWSVTDASGVPCLIDDDMATMEADNFMSGFEVGTVLTSVTGIFNFSFGSYKIQIRDMDDLGELGVNNDIVTQPYHFALYPNYPNPFNPETRIRFELAEPVGVKLVIYDLLGRKVRLLTSGTLDAGQHIVNWDGRNDAGAPVSSGVYIYRIKAGDFLDQRKMILVR